MWPVLPLCRGDRRKLSPLRPCRPLHHTQLCVPSCLPPVDNGEGYLLPLQPPASKECVFQVFVNRLSKHPYTPRQLRDFLRRLRIRREIHPPDTPTRTQ